MTAALLTVLLLHESGVSSSRLVLDGAEARVTFTFSLEDLAGLARLDTDRNGIVDREEWTRVLPAIFDYVGRHFRIEGCRSEGDATALPAAARLSDLRTPVALVVRFIPSAPLDRLKIRCDLFSEHGGNPRHIAELPGGTAVFDADRHEVDRPIAGEEARWPWTVATLATLLAMIPVLLAAARSA